ncbi:MAG: helix-turn-helix domain-containing protein [Bacteroidia bacterium]
MAATILTTEDLHIFKNELFEELKIFLTQIPEKKQEQQPPKLLKSHQVQRLLSISPGTLQNLRINGTIPYTKVGGVILYSMDDINAIMQRNKRNDFSHGKK